MEKKMGKGSLSRRFSTRKSLGSLKTRFKRFLSDRHFKAGEGGEYVFSATGGSDSDGDGKKSSSPSRPETSGEIEKSLSSGSSSDGGELSQSSLEKKPKFEGSSDLSEETKKKKGPSKFSRKKLQLHLQQDREEPFRLPPLEETPPTSPQSNPRFSTGAQSDYARLWTHASAPNSPANLAHNFHLSYRGGDSSPLTLVHSLSEMDRGRHPSQLSEISFASPPSSSSLDLDALGIELEDMTASPTKMASSLQLNGLPIVHHDEEQGVWRCASCGWIYPYPNPSLRNTREHKNHCGEFSNVQSWLGAQDAPGKGPLDPVEDLEVWEGSGSKETMSTPDDNLMRMSHREVSNEGVSDQGKVDDMESNGLLDYDAVVGECEGPSIPSAAANRNAFDDQKLNKVRERPSLDDGTKNQSSFDWIMSNGSSNHHEVTDQSKSEDEANGSSGHHGIEDISKLEDVSIGLSAHCGSEDNRKLDDLVSKLEDVFNLSSAHDSSEEISKLDDSVSKSEDVSNGASAHYRIEGINKFDDSASFIAENEKEFDVHAGREHDSFGDVGSGERNAYAAANRDEAEHQGFNRVSESTTLDAGKNDQSNSDGILSHVSSNPHEVTGQSKLEIVSDWTTGRNEIEEVSKLDDSAAEADVQKDEAVEDKFYEFHDVVGDEGNGGISPNVAVHPDQVEGRKLNDFFDLGTFNTGTRDQSSANEMGLDDSLSQYEATARSKLEDVSYVHHETEEVSKLDDTASSTTFKIENEIAGAVGVQHNQEGANLESSHVIGSEVKFDESRSSQKMLLDIENEVGHAHVQPWYANGKLSSAVVNSNGHDFVHGDSSADLKEECSANRDHLNYPDDGLPKVPEVHSELSVPTSDTEVWVGQGTCNVRNEDDLDNQVPGEDVEPVVEAEPRIITFKGRPIVLAELVGEPDLLGPSFSRAEILSRGVEIGSRDVQATNTEACEVKNVDMVIPKPTELSHPQSSCLEPVKDLKTIDNVSDSSREQKVSESDRMEGNSTRELPSQYSGIWTENGGRVAGPPRSLEDSPKWVNTVMVTSQDEGDTFISMQKYWASVTRSEYLLVDGNKSPSFRSRDNIGFPFLKNVEGRSVSPLSDGKSGDVEAQRSVSVDSVDNHSPVVGSSGERIIPSLAAIHLDGSSSSGVHVNDNFGKVLDEQNGHNLICPVCGSDVTRRITLEERKRTHVQDDEIVDEPTMIQEGGGVGHPAPQVEESDDATWGCLACLSFFTSRGGGEEQIPPVSGDLMETEHESVRGLPTFSRLGHETTEPDTSKEDDCAEIEALEDANERESNTCVPELLPAFSWGQVPVHTHSSLDMSESDAMKKEEEPSAGRTTALLTQKPRGVEDAEEKTSFNILPDIKPASSWGSIPVCNQLTLDAVGSANMEEQEECTAVSPSAPSKKDPQLLGDDKEKGTSNCLPELLPSQTSGPTQVYAHPPPDNHEFTGEEQQQEASAGGPSVSVTQEPELLGDAVDKGSANCLPGLLPALKLGSIPVYTPPSETYESAGDIECDEGPADSRSMPEVQEPQASEDSGKSKSFNCLPGLLPTFSWRSSPKAPTGRVDERPVDAEEDIQSSHLEAKECATCGCLPLLFPAFQWGFMRTSYGSGLQEPLLPPDSPTAFPVPSDDTSTHPVQRTVTVADPPSITRAVDRPKITDSEDFHIEGIVSSQKALTKGEPSEKP